MRSSLRGSLAITATGLSPASLHRLQDTPLALRPAKLLAHHPWALSRGFIAAGFPAPMLVSYQT
jgi:hypothetical protein